MTFSSEIEFSLMAGAAYEDTRKDPNKIPRPEGWDLLPDKSSQPLWHRLSNVTGFEGTAFVKDKEIVISFAGTYPGVQDFGADIFLGARTVEGQLLGAAHYLRTSKIRTRKATVTTPSPATVSAGT